MTAVAPEAPAASQRQSAQAAQDADWQAFMDWPSSYIDAGRLDACFEGRLGRELCGRLRTVRRLRERVSRIVAEHYELAPPMPLASCGDGDRVIVLAMPERLGEIARRSGAIYWARAIAGVVRASEVAALHRELDETLCGFALAHRDLAGAQALGAIEGIGARCAEDGLRCMAAFTRVLPEAVGQRTRLKLAAQAAIDTAPQPPFSDVGPEIVRRAAT